MIKITYEGWGEKLCECPVCGVEADVYLENKEYQGKLYSIIKCDRCGFVGYPENSDDEDELLTGRSPTNFELAGYLYETKENNKVFYITPENLEDVADSPILPKTPTEHLDKICLNLYNKGGYNYLRGVKVNCVPLSIGYAEFQLELDAMFQALIDQKLVRIVTDSILGDEPEDIPYYCLTHEGLKYAESLINSNKESTRVFIAMKFNDEMRNICKKAIKPACKKMGFVASTVDEEEYLGDITDRIISSIKTSRFVIADFTYNNQGVYYEAGYAKGLGIPVIKTCKKEWFDGVDEKGNKNKLHFDIEHDNLILWKDAKDLKERLEARIQAVIL